MSAALMYRLSELFNEVGNLLAIDELPEEDEEDEEEIDIGDLDPHEAYNLGFDEGYAQAESDEEKEEKA